MEQLYFSDKQIAARYGVHRTTIWRWIKKYNFPRPYQLSPGCSRWPKDKIDQWDKAIQQGGAT